MDWQIMVALIAAIPIILFPVAFIWYLNIGGIYTAFKGSMARRTATREKEKKLAVGNK
jgi:hypothetical protein